MVVRGDVEQVNLVTGQRFQRVCGNGENWLEELGAEPLTPDQLDVVRDFVREMGERTIPEILRTVRERQRAAQETRHIPLYHPLIAQLGGPHELEL